MAEAIAVVWHCRRLLTGTLDTYRTQYSGESDSDILQRFGAASWGASGDYTYFMVVGAAEDADAKNFPGEAFDWQNAHHATKANILNTRYEDPETGEIHLVRGSAVPPDLPPENILAANLPPIVPLGASGS